MCAWAGGFLFCSGVLYTKKKSIEEPVFKEIKTAHVTVSESNETKKLIIKTHGSFFRLEHFQFTSVSISFECCN